jgi:cell division protein FtsI/penicillin-binding protein 2
MKTKRQVKTGDPLRQVRSRLYFVGFLISVWILIVLGRLVWLQVVEHDKYKQRAKRQQESEIVLAAPRGGIVDREGQPLVSSQIRTSVYLDPKLFQTRQPKEKRTQEEKRQLAARLLGPLLGKSEAELVELIKRQTRFKWLRRKLEPESATELRQLVSKHGLSGIEFREEVVRSYPNKELAAHLLGYVGVNETQANQSGTVAAATHSKAQPVIEGVAGVERRFDQFLQGHQGQINLVQDAKRSAYQRYDLPATTGATVWLTIHAALQRKAELLLAQTVRQHRAKGGAVVILDPWTGEILAMANAPTFDPARMEQAVSGEVAYVNQAISAPYEPGSIFKIVTFAAALEEGVVRVGDRLDCGNGQIQIGRRVIRDTHSYGVLSVEEAFAKSSNVGAIRLAQRLGRETFHQYIRRFGFGERTKIDLPGEEPGIVHSPDRWNPDSIGSVAMGQEIAVTPLQAVAAVAAIANGGTWIQPHVVSKVTTPDRNTILYRPQIAERRVLSEETAARMVELMERVVTVGTGRHAIQLDGFTAAGKTGTPQKWVSKGGYRGGRYMPSFLGFVPASKPRFAIIVMVDEPSAGAYYGGVVAAPLFAQLAEVALGDLEVRPDDPEYRALLDRLAQLAVTSQGRSEMADGDELGRGTLSQTNALVTGRETFLPSESPQPIVERTKALVERAEEGSSRPVRAAGGAASSPARQGAALQPMPDLRGMGTRQVTEACLNLGLEVKLQGKGWRAVSQVPAVGTPVRPGDRCQVTFE